jgi:NTP pyrophosphatase (non-canonical NTP hydrolase)
MKMDYTDLLEAFGIEISKKKLDMAESTVADQIFFDIGRFEQRNVSLYLLSKLGEEASELSRACHRLVNKCIEEDIQGRLSAFDHMMEELGDVINTIQLLNRDEFIDDDLVNYYSAWKRVQFIKKKYGDVKIVDID